MPSTKSSHAAVNICHREPPSCWALCSSRLRARFSTVQLIAWFPVLFITFLASIYVLLKIPSLTNHIFRGTAGGSSASLLEAPAAVLDWVL